MRDSRVTAAASADARLVRRLLEGNRTALDEFCSLYAGRLYALGYRLTGKHDRALDFVVETFTRAFRGLEEVAREQLDLATYLRVTAKYVFLEEGEADAETSGSGWVWDDSEQGVLTRRRQDVARIASGALPPMQRLVLALCELEELSYAEIASLVDLSESDVARGIADARERLRVQLGIGEARRSDLRALCRMMVPLLSAHVDGETKDMRLEDVTAHVADCERCGTELGDLQEVSERYRSLIPPSPDEELRERTEAALVAAGLWSAPRAPAPARPRKRFVLAAAALLALAGAGIAASLLAPSNPVRRADMPAPSTPVPILIPTPPARHPTRGRAKPRHSVPRRSG